MARKKKPDAGTGAGSETGTGTETETGAATRTRTRTRTVARETGPRRRRVAPTIPTPPPIAAAFDPGRRVVALTGARGTIGAGLLRALEADGRVERILALDIRRPDAVGPKTEFHKLDLTLPTAGSVLSDVLRNAPPDTFVHAAFLSGPSHNTAWRHELEVLGTVHVLAACAAAGVRKFLLWSTTGVYGPHPLNPNFLDEEHELRGLGGSPFFNDKVEVEREVARFAADSTARIVTVLRTAPILGPDIDTYVTRFFRRPFAPVLMGYDPLLQFVHARDAVEAFRIATLEADAPGAFNVVGEGVLPYTTVLARLGRLPVPVPHFLAYPLARALWVTQVFESPPSFLDWLRYICVADGRRARDVLGFIPSHDVRAILDDLSGVPARAEPPAARAEREVA